DQLAESLGQSVSAWRVQGNIFFGGIPFPLAEVDAHRAGIDAALDAKTLGNVKEQVNAERVNRVVVLDDLDRLLGRATALRAEHHEIDEAVHAVERPREIVRIGDRALDVVDSLMRGRTHV